MEADKNNTPLKRNWREILRWQLGQRERFHVSGDSMLPTLQPGEDVIAKPLDNAAQIAVGDIVICQHPLKPAVRIIKRVSETFCDGSCYVLSDNAEAGSDSRTFGVVDRGLIIGQVTSRLF